MPRRQAERGRARGPIAAAALLLADLAAPAPAIAEAAARVEAARQVQAAEQRAEAAAVRAREAAAAARAADVVASERARALVPLLPVLQRLALWPAEAMLAAPVPPEDAARGLVILQALSRRLGTEAAAAAAALTEARERAATAAAEAQGLAAAREAAARGAAALDAELAEARRRRAAAPPEPDSLVAGRAAEGAGRAGDLEGALNRLRRPVERRPARATEAAATSLPALPDAALPDRARVPPVAGPTLRAFGAATEAGPARGTTWQGAPGGRVVSPCAGRVAFAAPFRGYGPLLIVECGDGQHVVLAGLERLDAVPGQRLLPGEPVGRLGGSEDRRPSLYAEVRHAGQPIDPRAWLAGNR